MTLEHFKLVHLIAFMLLFFGLGGLLISAYSGNSLSKQARVLGLISHGLGSLLLLTSGIGLLRSLNLEGNPRGWIMAKFGVLIYLGLAPFIIKKKGHLGWPVALVLFVVGAAAAAWGIYKPF